jgi:hypothetical protein
MGAFAPPNPHFSKFPFRGNGLRRDGDWGLSPDICSRREGYYTSSTARNEEVP